MHSGNSNEQGFSLIELMIGMGITLTIMAIAGALLSTSFNIRGRENRRTEALTAAQHALNSMGRDIANAGFGLKTNGIVSDDSDSSSIRIRANLNAFGGIKSTDGSGKLLGSGSLADRDEDVEYFLHKTDSDPLSTRGQLMRYDVNTQQSTLLVNNVDDFEIYYFPSKVDYILDSKGGIIVTTPDPNDLSGGTIKEVDDQSLTNYIVITVVLKLDAVGQPGSPGYVPESQVQLTTDVALRNRNLALF
jgi:type II secretory pathway pseudopilin PulG